LLCLDLLSVKSINAQEAVEQDFLIKDGPGYYETPEGIKDPILIPFRMHHGKPLMKLKINDKNATLMIDNGILWDEIWLFGSLLVEELKLEPINSKNYGLRSQILDPYTNNCVHLINQVQYKHSNPSP